MIGVLCDQHVGEQPGAGQSLINDVCRSRRLGQCFALTTRPFATDMAFDLRHAREVIEFFGNVFPDAFKLAATGARGGLGLVVNLNAGQFRR